MKHSEIVSNVARDLDISNAKAKEFVNEYLTRLVDAAFDNGSVLMPGFGTLSAKHMPSRDARNPATGETMKTQPKTVLKFKASKALERTA